MGPLAGIKVVEMAAIGPGPFCSMMLSDMGAEIIRIDRLNQKGSGHRANVLHRGRKSIAVDLKNPQGVEITLELIEQADVVVEGFRPGVMERLGLGPEVCLERNPKLVFGRMTGWGQDGPLSQAAGHDINYISVAGALGAMGYADRPPAPSPRRLPAPLCIASDSARNWPPRAVPEGPECAVRWHPGRPHRRERQIGHPPRSRRPSSAPGPRCHP